MKMCDSHWSMLREAINVRGMGHMVLENGEQLMGRVVAELEDRATDATFDPLFAAHNMIIEHALKWLGLYLMTGDYCPICEFCAHIEPPPEGHRYLTNESYMIDGPTDFLQKYCQDEGLLH